MGYSSLDQENKVGIMGYDDDNDSFSSDVSSVESLHDESDDALGDMSDLLRQLPSKRFGLSRHFQGKSQSFTSLSKVMCLEDLAKPDNPKNEKLKSCKSYVGLSRGVPPSIRNASSSMLVTKNISSGTSSSSLNNNSCRSAT